MTLLQVHFVVYVVVSNTVFIVPGNINVKALFVFWVLHRPSINASTAQKYVSLCKYGVMFNSLIFNNFVFSG